MSEPLSVRTNLPVKEYGDPEPPPPTKSEVLALLSDEIKRDLQEKWGLSWRDYL